MKNMIRMANFYANLTDRKAANVKRCRIDIVEQCVAARMCLVKWRDVEWLVLLEAKKPQNSPRLSKLVTDWHWAVAEVEGDHLVTVLSCITCRCWKR